MAIALMTDMPAAIENRYELSPLQEGMLIYTLGDSGSGMYMNQAFHKLVHVDEKLLHQAWQIVVDRHSILRTSFHWENLEHPEQWVHRHADLPFETLDWSAINLWEQDVRLQDFLREDIRRGFDLTQPPLIRVFLIKSTDTDYFLIFSHHHLLLDGWSHPLLLREVTTIYQGLRRGSEISLPFIRPYSDYILWLRKQDQNQAEAFWRGYLHGIRDATPLPTDLGAHRQRGYHLRFDECKISIEGVNYFDIQASARINHVTINTLIVAAWAIILSRYSGLKDVVFGMLVSGRPSEMENVESMVGMFLNTLPVRVTVEEQMNLRAWLNQLQRQQSELQRYEYTPLRSIQNWSELSRGSPLFESMIDNNNTPKQHEQAKSARAVLEKSNDKPMFQIRQNYPLLLDISFRDDALLLRLTYNTRRFNTHSITQIGEHLRTLLSMISLGTEALVDDLPMISATESHRLLYEWNQTTVPFDNSLTLPHIFAAQVRRTPEAIALIDGNQQLSYAALDRVSNKLAHYLRQQGVERESLVGLCVERSTNMVVGLLAILKAGGAYVPMDPNYPLERLQFMLADSQANLVLTTERMAGHFKESVARMVCLDRDGAEWEACSDVAPVVIITAEDLGYVLYTSGSTGTPKGVAIPHRVAVNRLFIEHDLFEPGESLGVKTSLSFVDSIWEMFSAWHNGLTTTLIPEPHVKDPHLLVDTLSTAGVTRIVLVPSLLRALLDSQIDLAARLPRLRHWISSGEPLPLDLSRTFMQRLPNAVLTNLYGTSEVWDACRSDSRQMTLEEPLPIGRPMGNVQLYVLDDRMRPCPIGVPGELYVGGLGLARGYWRRPELTAEKFIPHPFSEEPEARLYRSGDLVRWRPDGHLEYLSRRDQQVKLRGFRIELEEIESALCSHDAIQQAAVVVTDDQNLISFVVLKGELPTAEKLQQFLRAHLPEHMIPMLYLPLEALPTTPNGKIDRKALPKLKSDEVATHIGESNRSRPPETETEKKIAQIWSSMLGVVDVGADSDFFLLGGHSLLAARIVTRLSTLFGIQVPLRRLFDSRTVAALAEWVDVAIVQGDGSQDIPEVTRAERGKMVRLSFPQQRMWFLDQLNPGSLSYSVPLILHFRGPLHVEVLEQAVNAVVARHESLRTTFIARDGEPLQVIHTADDPQVKIFLSVIDLTALPEKEREERSRALMRDVMREPWDLRQGPLLRIRLQRITPEHHVFAVVMHHIITDGRSLGVFSHEMETFYQAFLHKKPVILPELALQYADYALWQRNWLQGETLERELGYWREQLADAAQLELPTDHPRPPIHRYRGGSESFMLDPQAMMQLQTLAQVEGATPFMALLAVYALMLSRYSGQEDICIGTPMGNRNQPALENIIGFFINTLVIRIHTDWTNFRMLLRQTRDICYAAFEHQEVPFDKIVDALGVSRNLNRHPLFQVLFVHQKAAPAQGSGHGFIAHQKSQEMETSNFDLVLVVQEMGKKLEGILQYNSDIFTPGTIQGMGRHFQLLFRQLALQPDRPLAEISMLSNMERARILGKWSSGVPRPLVNLAMHQLIERHVIHFPDHTAVCFNEQTMSYAELNRRANQLARHLRSRGVGPETIVGWCMERGFEMLVGLLGVLKAGGAFLPLDPAYPEERLAFMLADANVSLVLTLEHLRHLLPLEAAAPLCLDSDWQSIAAEADMPLENFSLPNHLVYVVYTSGSTGQPKGVLVTHSNLVNIITAQIPIFQITPESRVLQTLSISFDAALGEIFRTLVGGATLYLMSKEESIPGPHWAGVLENNRITTITLSPTMLAALPSDLHTRLPHLKTVTVGGDACPPELAQRWGKDRRFINGYGPTETTIGATLAVNWDFKSKPPLGRPLANVTLYVLDRGMQPVPIGTPGELYIGGVGVARGYLNRPDLTAERFLVNPFADHPNARFYRTGDLVRWLANGTLDFLGRMDHQVKIRGFRIELTEIEVVLALHPQVGQCVVLVNDQQGIKRLAAYLTPREADHPPLMGELRAYLKKNLPEHMIPAFLVVLAILPMTANGKIDRKALPQPNVKQMELENYVEPTNELERILAQIWANVLGVDRVGIHANFFELGGDSIMSIQVVSRAGEAGLKLTPQSLFQHQTIAELALVVEKITDIVVDQGLVLGEVPLTPVQIWFFSLEMPFHHFNYWRAIPVPGNFSPDAMQYALQSLLNHHDALRLRFEPTEHGWRQWISEPSTEIPFASIDLHLLKDQAEKKQRIADLFLAAQESFNLAQGPMVRMIWFNAGSMAFGRLLFIVHHLVVDIISWSILIEDLMRTYQTRVKSNATVVLPMKTTSFKRWSASLRNYLLSSKIGDEISFWLAQTEFSFGKLPLDHGDGDNTLASVCMQMVILDESTTYRLLQVAKLHFQNHVHHLLLAALAMTLCDWMHQRWTLINIESHGRESLEEDINIARTVGWFTCFYPLALEVDPDRSLRENLQATSAKMSGVAHNGIGYGLLRYLDGYPEVAEALSRMPAAQIAFNYTGQYQTPATERPMTAPEEEIWGEINESLGQTRTSESKIGQRRHILEVVGGIKNGQLNQRWVYSSNLHDRQTIEGLTEQFLHRLQKICEEMESYATKSQGHL
ncbi:MAG: amino acid adenylation domain-containing protein [Magnetococcus sp. DMHC-6]